MKKETQMKIVEGAINGVVNALFGKLNDGPNFDLLENYKTENFFKGTEGFLKAPLENAKWQLGYANVDLTPKDYKEKNYYILIDIANGHMEEEWILGKELKKLYSKISLMIERLLPSPNIF